MRSRRTRRTILVALALSAFAFVAACGPAAPPPPPPPSSPAAADAVERTNSVRIPNGLGALAVDGGMQANAQFHADRVAAGMGSCAGGLWHSSELAAWYPGVMAGENLACVPGCPSDARAAFDMWMASPPHQANVLRPEFTHIGVATRCNGSVEVFVAHYRSG